MEFCFMNAKIERNHLKLRANVEKVTDGISLEKGMEWNERNEPKKSVQFSTLPYLLIPFPLNHTLPLIGMEIHFLPS